VGRRTILITSEWILKWSANIVILFAAVATSFDFTPLNKYLFLAGSLGWMLVGILWRQPSLWTMNAVVSAIYIIGFFSK
jgi:hypothetical protein